MINLEQAKLITHKNCSDGAACAILFIKAGGKKENIIYSLPVHEQIDKNVQEVLSDVSVSFLILADISMSKQMADKVDKQLNDGLKVFLFDHHKTAIPLSGFTWCEIDKENTRCGSKIFFDWLVSQSMLSSSNAYGLLIELIDDRDRWQNCFNSSKTLSTLFQIVGQNSFIERFLNNPDVLLSEKERYVIDIEEQKLKEYIEEKKKEIFVKKKIVDGKEYTFGFITSDKYLWNSDLGNAIVYDKTLGIDVAIMVMNNSVSARAPSTSEIDLSKIAQKNGGGGHRLAAGWPLNGVLKASLEEIVEHEIRL